MYVCMYGFSFPLEAKNHTDLRDDSVVLLKNRRIVLDEEAACTCPNLQFNSSACRN